MSKVRIPPMLREEVGGAREVPAEGGNVRELLDLRNFIDNLRSSGVQTGGPGAFSQSDRQAFANQLDRFLARQKR